MKKAVMVHLAAISALLLLISPGMLGESGAKSFLAASIIFAEQAGGIPTVDLIQAGELAKLLTASTAEKPLLIQVGSHVLYEEAHIPGSEYIGPAASAAGLGKLRQRLQPVPRKKFIVLYCGCCPWSHCPNIKPAWDLARSMGFSKIKALYIADNFGADWLGKGYPAEKGE
jgi:hypothetical protein